MVNEFYDKIRDEIQQDYYQQNFPNDGQRFIAWYLRVILNKDMNETKEAITDGADDKQIDAIIVDEDKSTIYVLQGKFIGSAKVDSEPLREVLSSWVQLRDLVRLQEVANDKLKRKLAEVARAFEDEYEVAFELLTTGDLTDAAKKDLETFQQNLSELSEKEDFAATITLVNNNELQRRYEVAIEQENPSIRHVVNLTYSKYVPVTIAGTQSVIAALPLKECLEMPGIIDGTLFQKNVRQSLGLNNAVNKGIKNTIYGDKYKDFFFFHNGITAICNKMQLEDNCLVLEGLSVVNGCQSLNTILSCSERVKKLDDTYILFRFYEIPQRERADRISIYTNSQSSVKPRDLRSNDKKVLNLKKMFEQKYPTGYFSTKRGELIPADKNQLYVLDLSDFGKLLMAWHSQRPNISYSETKIFDKYFEQLFKRDYNPEDAQSLNLWIKEVRKYWTDKNPLNLNDTLLAMKAYAPYHQLYAISMCFAITNNMSERVPNPTRAWLNAKQNNMVDDIIKVSGKCVNTAMKVASNRKQPGDSVFSPQNWIKSKTCLNDVNAAIDQYFDMLPTIGGDQLYAKYKETLTLPQESFDYRWAAD